MYHLTSYTSLLELEFKYKHISAITQLYIIFYHLNAM